MKRPRIQSARVNRPRRAAQRPRRSLVPLDSATKKQIMGDYVNTKWQNFVTILTCVFVIILTLLMVITTLM